MANQVNPRTIGLFSFLLILSGQILWVFFYGTDVPQGDQWDGEFFWYKAMVSGEANWDALIAPHNEHRIAATRLFNSLIFKLLGGWRPIVVMYAQSILISFSVAMLCYLIWRYGGRWRSAAVFFTLVAYLLPYSWQNTLGGFQNQFYFMLLFALVALGLLSWSVTWPKLMTALLLAALSPFTTAGGLMIIPVFIIIVVLGVFARRLSFVKFATLMTLSLPVAAWHLAHLHHVPGHDVLMARSIGEFCISLLKVFSWPESPIGLFFWGSIFYGILRDFRGSTSLSGWLTSLQPIQIFVIGSLMWLMLQLAATAYSRTHSDLMAARYQQTYSLMIPLFFLSLSAFTIELKWLRVWLVAAILVVGLIIRTGREWPYMSKGVADMRFAKTEISRAVEINNFAYLKSKEKSEFSLGYSPAEAIWQRAFDDKMFPYHLWLKGR